MEGAQNLERVAALEQADDDDARRRGAELGVERRGRGSGALRVLDAVDDREGPAAHHLEAAGRAHAGEAFGDDVRV